MSPLRGYISSYPPRVRQYGNALLAPVIPQNQTLPPPRTTKRGTTAINYAEDGYDDDDFDENEGPRRPTGLRSLRREDSSSLDKVALAEKLGKEIHGPVEVQGVFRDWMIKRMLRPAYVASVWFCLCRGRKLMTCV
jgi:chromatin structure-remodeling complex subunit SFH1